MLNRFFLVCFFLVTLAVSVLCDCPDAPKKPADRRHNKKLLTVAAYNTEWLFLNARNCPGDGCPWKSHEEAMVHLKDVAKEIAYVNPDIIVLEEVNNCDVLYTLNATLSGSGYEPYLLQGTDTSTGQNVALLTRVDPVQDLRRTENRTAYPIQGSKCGYSGEPGTYGVSKHFYTTFNIDGLKNPLTLIGAHLLAFPDQSSRCSQREAQAIVLQGIIRQGLEAGHNVILGGDLNDYDGTVVDCCGDVPISQVLSILKDPISNNPGDELATAAEKINQASRYTCWYSDCDDPIKSSIDHILVSNELANNIVLAGINHNYDVTCDTTYNSDHWPIYVQFETNEL